MIISFHRCKKQRKLKSTETVDLKTTEYITKMSDDVEQITKTPVESNDRTKEKDPKKVAAGKRLAEYNKRAKEALKEKMKREAEKEEESKDLTAAEGWIPEISFTTAISLAGIVLTALNMFMSYRKDTEIDPPPAIERPQQSKIPIPKMGML